MTDREAFKVGFLMRCAEEGLSAEMTGQRIEKASSIASGVGSVIGGASKGALGLLKSLGWATAIVPPVAGAAGGYALSKLEDDTFDAEEAKKDEELAEYYRAIDQLSRSRRLKQQAHV